MFTLINSLDTVPYIGLLVVAILLDIYAFFTLKGEDKAWRPICYVCAIEEILLIVNRIIQDNMPNTDLAKVFHILTLISIAMLIISIFIICFLANRKKNNIYK